MAPLQTGAVWPLRLGPLRLDARSGDAHDRGLDSRPFPRGGRRPRRHPRLGARRSQRGLPGGASLPAVAAAGHARGLYRLCGRLVDRGRTLGKHRAVDPLRARRRPHRGSSRHDPCAAVRQRPVHGGLGRQRGPVEGSPGRAGAPRPLGRGTSTARKKPRSTMCCVPSRWRQDAVWSCRMGRSRDTPETSWAGSHASRAALGTAARRARLCRSAGAFGLRSVRTEVETRTARRPGISAARGPHDLC